MEHPQASKNHSMGQVGRDHRGSSGLNCSGSVILEHRAQDNIQIVLEYLQWGKLHNISGQSVPVHKTLQGCSSVSLPGFQVNLLSILSWAIWKPTITKQNKKEKNKKRTSEKQCYDWNIYILCPNCKVEQKDQIFTQMSLDLLPWLRWHFFFIISSSTCGCGAFGSNNGSYNR